MTTHNSQELTDHQCRELIGFYGVRRRIERTRNNVYLALLVVFGAMLTQLQFNDATLAWWHFTLAVLAIIFVLAYEALMSSVMTGGKNHLMHCGLSPELIQFVSTNSIAKMDRRLASWNAECRSS